MDKIEKIRQEIERRINILTNVYAEQVERKDEEMMNYYHGKVIALEELRPFLDTLSEEPDKSLEEAAKDAVEMMFGCDPAYFGNKTEITAIECERLFIAGANWQYQRDREEFAKIKAKTWCEGFDAHKEQMLKGAVEGYVDKDHIVTEGPFYYIRSRNLDLPNRLKEGDKVRIVVLKAEED